MSNLVEDHSHSWSHCRTRHYRLSLIYRNDELRQKWVASPRHQRVWPTIENTLSSKNYTVLLFDVD